MLFKRLLTLAATAHIAVGAAVAAPEPLFNKTTLNDVSKSAIKSLLMMKAWKTGWDWDQGIGLYGIWKHYEATGDKESLAAVQDWYTNRLPAGQTKHVNSMAVMSTLVDLYTETRDAKWLPYLEDWGYWAMYNLTRTEGGGMQHVIGVAQNKGQLWVDTLMMAAIPLAKIGVLLNKPEYVTEAKKQFDIHIKYLYDEEANLFFHGWTFIHKNNFGAVHWARGNAWAAITITEMLELLEKRGQGQDPKLRSTLDDLQLKLTKVRDTENGGLWRTVLDRPLSEGSYIETSASAGFVFSYIKAQRKGWITKNRFPTSTKKGVEGLLNSIVPNGEVKNVSAGTGVGKDAQHYYDIPKTKTMWGQGMAIMALTEAWQTLT